MVEWLTQIGGLLTGPLHYFFEPSKRLFWPFLLSALVLASVTVTVHRKSFKISSQFRALFCTRYWFNSSTKVDYGLLCVNSVLRTGLLLPILGSHLAATIAVGNFLQVNFGDAPNLGWPLLAIGIAYTLIFFIAEDFSRFSLHLALHKIPMLWRIHRVHHSATTLTPFTVHRVHPLEMFLYQLRGLVVFGVISGTFVYFFKQQVHGWHILGVDCLGFLFNFFGANLRHSHIPLSFGRLESVLISPWQHQLHHSSSSQHWNKNFGTCLSLWDRLIGSWHTDKTNIRLSFGLPIKPQPNR